MDAVQNYLVDPCCKNDVFGFDKIIDDSDYSVPHRLVENN